MDLTADNPQAPTMDNPVQTSEPIQAANGTGEPSGQAQGATPADDLFKNVDPNRLPPEVKSHYDSMLRDYREKTAKLSETIKSESAKAAEAYRQKAEQFDQILTQSEFIKQWNEYVEKSQGENQDPGQVDPKLSQLEAKFAEIDRKMKLAEVSQITDSFADAVNEKGEKLHPEFDRFSSIIIGKTPAGDFSLLRACTELASGTSPVEKLTNGYQMAEQVFKSIFEEGRKAGLGRIQSKVMNGTIPPSNSTSNGLSVTDKKPKNAHEAMEMARRGLLVSRD